MGKEGCIAAIIIIGAVVVCGVTAGLVYAFVLSGKYTIYIIFILIYLYMSKGAVNNYLITKK